MKFDVIDTETGEYPDVEKIALTEEWAKGLIYCDIDCFAVNEDGSLILIDDCGNIAYPPEGRFEIVPEKEANEPLTLEQLRQMDGEPVWVKCLKPRKYVDPPERWRILEKSITGNFGVWNGENCLIERDYGTDWLAYRRPPEGEENGE